MDLHLPSLIHTETELDDVLTRPSPALIEFIRTVPSPLLILGAGGKMGPSLAVLARRAAQAANHPLEVVAVSRLSDATAREWLEARGVRAVAADLSQRQAVQRLPEASHVLYLVGLKFGTSQSPERTWAMNTLVPAYVAERFSAARLVTLSSGNVYPLTPISMGGAAEDHPLTPLGEYSNACVARERIFQYFAGEHGTAGVLVRLSYAVDLRYGVLLDLAEKIWRGEPVDVSMGYLNFIWQGDANDFILRCLGLTQHPPLALNLTGPAAVPVRELAHRLGDLLSRPVTFVGQEAETALLTNTRRMQALLGAPATSVDTQLRWTAHWVAQGGRTLRKPTHFEVRDGAY